MATPDPDSIDHLIDVIDAVSDAMERHELSEVEVEHRRVRVRLRKGQDASAGSMPTTSASSAPVPDQNLVSVRAPIVGRFFRAPEPNARPFTEVGERVERGQVLCIIEAMKLMNEIEAQDDGIVERIFVESGNGVQYGDLLFSIRK